VPCKTCPTRYSPTGYTTSTSHTGSHTPSHYHTRAGLRISSVGIDLGRQSSSRQRRQIGLRWLRRLTRARRLIDLKDLYRRIEILDMLYSPVISNIHPNPLSAPLLRPSPKSPPPLIPDKASSYKSIANRLHRPSCRLYRSRCPQYRCILSELTSSIPFRKILFVG